MEEVLYSNTFGQSPFDIFTARRDSDIQRNYEQEPELQDALETMEEMEYDEDYDYDSEEPYAPRRQTVVPASKPKQEDAFEGGFDYAESSDDDLLKWRSPSESFVDSISRTHPNKETPKDDEDLLLKKTVRKTSNYLYILYFCFFMCGIATALAWNTTLTVYSYFQGKYGPVEGPKVLGINLACYNVPALPIAIAQTFLDRRADLRFGFKLTYSIRILVSNIIFIVVLLNLAYFVPNLDLYVLNVTLIGIASGIIYGAMFQLVTLFPLKCTAFLYMGNGFSTLLNVGISAIYGLVENASYSVVSFDQIHRYFITTAGFILACTAAFFVLLTNKITKNLLRTAERAHHLRNEQTAINEGETPSPSSEPILKMLYRLKYHALCIFTNKAGNVFVLSFFSILPHTTIEELPHIITYFAITCDTIGRNLTLFKSRLFFLKTGFAVFVFSLVVRGGFSIFFVFYNLGLTPVNDYAIIVGVSLHFLLGGYLNSLSYTLVSQDAQGSTKVGATMNIVNQIGAYFGIGVPMLIKAYYDMKPAHSVLAMMLGSQSSFQHVLSS